MPIFWLDFNKIWWTRWQSSVIPMPYCKYKWIGFLDIMATCPHHYMQILRTQRQRFHHNSYLHFRPEFGKWQSASLHPGQNKITSRLLTQLDCETVHQSKIKSFLLFVSRGFKVIQTSCLNIDMQTDSYSCLWTEVWF